MVDSLPWVSDISHKRRAILSEKLPALTDFMVHEIPVVEIPCAAESIQILLVASHHVAIEEAGHGLEVLPPFLIPHKGWPRADSIAEHAAMLPVITMGKSMIEKLYEKLLVIFRTGSENPEREISKPAELYVMPIACRIGRRIDLLVAFAFCVPCARDIHGRNLIELEIELVVAIPLFSIDHMAHYELIDLTEPSAMDFLSGCLIKRRICLEKMHMDIKGFAVTGGLACRGESPVAFHVLEITAAERISTVLEKIIETLLSVLKRFFVPICQIALRKRIDSEAFTIGELGIIMHRSIPVEKPVVSAVFLIPESVDEEALAVLRLFGGRKFVVTPGLVELGVLEEEENAALGEKLAGLDRVILVGATLVTAVKRGYLAAGGDAEKLTLVPTLAAAETLLSEELAEGDAVLFLNDLPDIYN